MITRAFSIYDSKAQCFNVPFFQPTVPSAVRMFSDLANDPQSMVFKHPGDFVLYEIGEYDDSVGKLVNMAEHRHLGVATQYKEVAVPVRNGGVIDPRVQMDEVKDITKIITGDK